MNRRLSVAAMAVLSFALGFSAQAQTGSPTDPLTVLPKAPDIDYAGLTAAMKGHVLASGELVGLSYADPEAKPPAPKG